MSPANKATMPARKTNHTAMSALAIRSLRAFAASSTQVPRWLGDTETADGRAQHATVRRQSGGPATARSLANPTASRAAASHAGPVARHSYVGAVSLWRSDVVAGRWLNDWRAPAASASRRASAPGGVYPTPGLVATLAERLGARCLVTNRRLLLRDARRPETVRRTRCARHRRSTAGHRKGRRRAA